MTTYRNISRPDVDDAFSIEPQGGKRCLPYDSEADNVESIGRPDKVVAP
jgi:hypothetical protein